MIYNNPTHIKTHVHPAPRQLYVPGNGANNSIIDHGGRLNNIAEGFSNPNKVMSPYGWACDFNGTDQYFHLGNSSLENFTRGTVAGPHTAMAVIKADSLGESHFLASWKNTPLDNRGWSLRFRTNRIIMQSYDGTLEQVKATDTTVSTDVWYAVVAFFPGLSDFSDKFYLIVNGVKHTRDESTGTLSLLDNTGWHASLGARVRFDTSTPANFFNGQVAMAAYWDHKLPESIALRLSKDPMLLVQPRRSPIKLRPFVGSLIKNLNLDGMGGVYLNPSLTGGMQG